MSLSDVSIGNDPFGVGDISPSTLGGGSAGSSDPLTPIAPSPITGGTYLGSNTTSGTDWFGLGSGTPINQTSGGTTNPLQSDPFGIGALDIGGSNSANPAIAGNQDVWGSLTKNVTGILGSVASSVSGIFGQAAVNPIPTGVGVPTVASTNSTLPILALVAVVVVFLLARKG